jgi:hypothetical protein
MTIAPTQQLSTPPRTEQPRSAPLQQQRTETSVIVAAVLLSVISLGYCLPLTIAMCRRSEKTDKISCLNILTGWTVVGWIASLIWALGEKPHHAIAAPTQG